MAEQELIHTLIAGKAICVNSYPVFYHLLTKNNADNDSDVPADDTQASPTPDRRMAETTLATMGRRLTCINEVYFAAFEQDNPTSRDRIEKRFNNYIKNIENLSTIFDILRLSRASGDDLEAGDMITISQIFNAVDNNNGLLDRLIQVLNAVNTSKNAKNPAPDQAARMIIEWLERKEYVVQASSRHATYIVTGEKALFDAFRDLVMEVENIIGLFTIYTNFMKSLFLRATLKRPISF